MVIKESCQKGTLPVDIAELVTYNQYKVTETVLLEVMTLRRVNLEKIKKLRKEKKISLEEMAHILGYESQNGYYYLEVGRGRFTAETLAKVADILGVSIDSLFFTQKVTKTATGEAI